MGYELNTQAYQLFIQIEVGIREFFIQIIQKRNVNDWVTNFLGNYQRDSLNDIVQRINNSKKSNISSNIEDQYLYKLHRARKELELYGKTYKLYHPFYYLNWNDLEALLRIKFNSEIFDQEIGKNNRELLALNLKNLTLFRNHIAHSRFISENDFKIILSNFNQISSLIPNFDFLVKNQTDEDTIGSILITISNDIDLILNSNLLVSDQIIQILKHLEISKQSFWLNSLNLEITHKLINLYIKMEEYRKFREIPGGLYEITKWKENNLIFLQNLLNDTKNDKF
jgi:hypothetical protein